MRSGLASVLLLTLLPCLAFAAPAQGPRDPAFVGPPEPVPPAVASRDEAGHVTIRAIRLAEPIVLDGRLDERVYRETEAIGDFCSRSRSKGRHRPTRPRSG